jgi:hypothetical protein
VGEVELAELLGDPELEDPLGDAEEPQVCSSGPSGRGAAGPPLPQLMMPLPDASVEQWRSFSSMSTKAVIVVPPGALLHI